MFFGSGVVVERPEVVKFFLEGADEGGGFGDRQVFVIVEAGGARPIVASIEEGVAVEDREFVVHVIGFVIETEGNTREAEVFDL